MVYGIVILPIAMIALFRKSKKDVKHKLIYIISLVVLFAFIIKSNFATAFIFMILGILLSITNFNKKKRMIVSVILIGLALITLFNLDTVIDIITDMLPNDSIIAIRLNEITEFGSQDDIGQSSSFDSRIDLLKKSIESVIANPLGVGYSSNFDYDKIVNTLGLHNEWIDLVGKYGIVVGGLTIYFIISSLIQLYKDMKFSNCSHEIKVSIGIIILLGFFNPIATTSIFLIEFVLVPCLLKNVLEGKNEKNI